MGMGEKNPRENAKMNKNKENIPCLVSLPFPLLRYGGRLFPLSENTKNQAEVGGVPNLMEKKKIKQGRAR